MKLTTLLKSTPHKSLGYIDDINITDITLSSRLCKAGTLFIAQKGTNFDGHLFAEEAITLGASALVLERPLPQYNIPQIIVPSTRTAIASIAATFYGNPHKRLKFIGVTGTNGKTSCTHFIATALNMHGRPCALLGTTGAFFMDKEYSSNLTTPDPLVFHRLLKEFLDAGARYVAMEVSAHAIALEKLSNITFEVGILTNITTDHLDYFKTLSRYARTKTSWVIGTTVKTAIVNFEDKFCKKILGKKNELLSFSVHSQASTFLSQLEKTPTGYSFILNLNGTSFPARTTLAGMFNLSNITAVCTALSCIGLSHHQIQKSIPAFQAPAGRFNILKFGSDKTIIVDFAHTPDGLEKALLAGREISSGRLISLFGCGGDRDKTKRPTMGTIAERLSDFVIITSDNPRFEKPENILNEIETGFLGHNYLKIADRPTAIHKLLSLMQSGDTAIICGKGAEPYQDILGTLTPYSDFDEIKKSALLLGEDITPVKEDL